MHDSRKFKLAKPSIYILGTFLFLQTLLNIYFFSYLMITSAFCVLQNKGTAITRHLVWVAAFLGANER